MKKTKVFGVGYHKTGTSTLNVALRILGYKVCGNQTWLASDLIDHNYDKVLNLLEDYDACEDTPWPILFKKLDERFPGSKFILTSRETDEWIKSVKNHFGGHSSLMREWIYGVDDPLKDEKTYINKYTTHNEEVKKYFRDRPEDLLIIDWKENNGWKKLCNFLNEPEPKKTFPHANKGAYTNKSKVSQTFKVWIYHNLLKPFGYGR